MSGGYPRPEILKHYSEDNASQICTEYQSLKLSLTHWFKCRVPKALSANASEAFFLIYLFQVIPGLDRLTYNPSRKSMYSEAYNFYSSIYLPKDLLKIIIKKKNPKPKEVAKHSLPCLRNSFFLHTFMVTKLFVQAHTEFFSTYSYLRKQTARQKRKTNRQCCLCSRAALNEFPKILNPQIKALVATSLPKTFRETSVWWPNGYKHKELKVRLPLK